MAKLVEVIETDELRGIGTVENPIRRVQQFWSRDGELLMEKDPCDPFARDAIALAVFIVSNPNAARGAGDAPHAAYMRQQGLAARLLEQYAPESLPKEK